ncbi:rhomboid family intramembrane serine protease [soil metagenome]
MSITRDIQNALRGNNGALFRLLIINVVVWLLVNILVNVFSMQGEPFPERIVKEYSTLPAGLENLLYHFWTIFTYMFVHFSFMHLLGNMLWLYFLGRVFCDLLGSARMTGVYIIGGLCGGLVFVVIENLLTDHPEMYSLEGASAGVMAIVIAAAAFRPDYMMFPFGFAMKLKWLALISFVLTSIIDLNANTGGKIAHIGGALFGFIYGTQMRHGKKFMEGFMNLFRLKKNNLRVEYSRAQKTDDHAYNAKKLSIRKQVDEILDKISRSGYDSLNKEEKDFLQKNHDKF